jgi:hypothetical protein
MSELRLRPVQLQHRVSCPYRSRRIRINSSALAKKAPSSQMRFFWSWRCPKTAHQDMGCEIANRVQARERTLSHSTMRCRSNFGSKEILECSTTPTKIAASENTITSDAHFCEPVATTPPWTEPLSSRPPERSSAADVVSVPSTKAKEFFHPSKRRGIVKKETPLTLDPSRTGGSNAVPPHISSLFIRD